VSPANLTAIGGIVVPLLVLGMVPILLSRQSRKRDEELAERQEIRDQAERDAKAAAGDIVSWEKVTQTLSATVQQERAEFRERLVELREMFTAEADRLKRLTDMDLDRVKAENSRLAEQVRRLEERLAQMSPRAAP
jgi:response regulator RpfG family c-di-GMP phosphodiesterase